MLFIVHARWIIKTKCTIIKDICPVIYKADDIQEAWTARHLIFFLALRNLSSESFMVVMMCRRREQSHGGVLWILHFSFICSIMMNNKTIVKLLQKRRHRPAREAPRSSFKHAWCSDLIYPVQTQVTVWMEPDALPVKRWRFMAIL